MAHPAPNVEAAMKSPGWSRLAALILVASALGALPVRPAAAQATAEPAGPRFILLLANNTVDRTGGAMGMTYPWQGVGTPRDQVVIDAIKQVVTNAPAEVRFGIWKTWQNGPYPGSASVHQVAPVDSTRTELLYLLDQEYDVTADAQGQDMAWSESYSNLIYHYLSATGVTDGVHSGWSRSPFDNDCSEVHVVVIGSGIGYSDNGYNSSWVLTSPSYTTPDDYRFPAATDTQTRLDNIAWYAHNNDLSALADPGGVPQTVVTDTILVDATFAESYALSLFEATANAGGGLYFEANQVHDVAIALNKIITNAYDGEVTRSGPVVSTGLDYLFQGYFEIVAGNPLFQGHLRYYALEDDPADENYGQILDGGGPDASLWDAGEILASRYAVHAEYNTDSADVSIIDYTNPRAIYTHAAGTGFPYDAAPAELVPFDRSSVESTDLNSDGDYMDPGEAGDLVDLLVPQAPTDITDCDDLDYDLDQDCDVDPDDAQLVVDFLRGVNELQDPANPAAGSFGKENPDHRRDSWKLGSINHSKMAYAPGEPDMLTSKPDFYNFLNKIKGLSSMLYVTSNDGMLHAFNVPETPGDSNNINGGWEWWAYMPRHLLAYDYESVWAERENRSIQQRFAGETFTNDGSVNLEYVWMDNVCNYLANPDDPGATDNCADVDDDNVPAVSGAEWHRVLVVTMGGGSRHVFALDVCNPSHPLFLWEVPGGSDGLDDYAANVAAYTAWGRGQTVSRPSVGVVYDDTRPDSPQRWVAFWGSGLPFDNVRTRGAQYYVHPNLYMVDLLDPFGTDPSSPADEGVLDERGFSIPLSAENTSLVVSPDPDADPEPEYDPTQEAALFGSPASVDVDGDGGIDVVYIGDRSGHLYKYVMNNADLNDPTKCLFSSPATHTGLTFVEDDTYGLYYRPTVTFDLDGTLKVFYGTGSPLSLNNYRTPGLVYMYEDASPFQCDAGVPADCANPAVVDGVLTLADGEKLVGNPVVAAGVLYFTTYVGDSNPCEVGDGRLWGLSIDDCTGALYDYDGDSYTVDSGSSITIPGIPSELTFANDSIYVSTTSPGAAPSVLDPIRVAPTGSEMARHVFSNWRNIF